MQKYKHKFKQITLSLLIIFLTVIAAIQASQALFTDTELSQNTISLGTLNLQVGQDDPSVLALDFSGMMAHETRTYEAQIQNTGEINGNFWFEPEVTNSLEGANPESETNTTDDGEMDDCVRLRVSFSDPTNDPISVIDYALLKILDTSYETDPNTLVDNMINGGEATMTIMVNTDNCDNQAMGDTVDLNLLFHLDQVN